MYNRIILIGNLTKDPDLRYTPQGTPVGNIRIAVNSRVKQGDKYKDEVLFMSVVTFGRLAENSSQYLVKGRRVLVEGRLKENVWEHEGRQKRKFEVVATTVMFLPKGNSSREDASEDFCVPGDATELEPF